MSQEGTLMAPTQNIKVEFSQSAERKLDRIIRALEKMGADPLAGTRFDLKNKVAPLEGDSYLSEEEKLRSLPLRTVVAGPEWNDEVYQRSDEDEWYAIGSNIAWTTAGLATRGPFHVLRRGR